MSTMLQEQLAPSRAQLTRIEALLDAEFELAQELRPVLVRKQRALIANRVEELSPLTGLELSAATRFAATEAAREQAVGDLARLFGLDEEGLTLARLLDRLQGEELADAIGRKARALAVELDSLAQLNADNAYLTQNLLDYTAFLTRLVAMGLGEASYTRDGRVSASQLTTRQMLDDRL